MILLDGSIVAGNTQHQDPHTWPKSGPCSAPRRSYNNKSLGSRSPELLRGMGDGASYNFDGTTEPPPQRGLFIELTAMGARSPESTIEPGNADIAPHGW